MPAGQPHNPGPTWLDVADAADAVLACADVHNCWGKPVVTNHKQPVMWHHPLQSQHCSAAAVHVTKFHVSGHGGEAGFAADVGRNAGCSWFAKSGVSHLRAGSSTCGIARRVEVRWNVKFPCCTCCTSYISTALVEPQPPMYSSMFYHMNHVLKRYKAAMKSSRAETFQNFRRMRTLVHQVGMSVLWHRELAGSDSPAASTNVAADHWPLRRQYQLEVAYQEDWA